jgi:hypothetical protein
MAEIAHTPGVQNRRDDRIPATVVEMRGRRGARSLLAVLGDCRRSTYLSCWSTSTAGLTRTPGTRLGGAAIRIGVILPAVRALTRNSLNPGVALNIGKRPWKAGASV